MNCARTCGNCGHGSPGRFNMIACALQSKASVQNPNLPCPIGKWIAISEQRQARHDAQAGIDQAVAAAEREIRGWSDVALKYVRLFATQNRGKRYIGRDIVQASLAAGIVQPPNPKAWGGPIQRAARAGYIVKVGTAPDPNRHTNPVPLWESGELAALEAA